MNWLGCEEFEEYGPIKHIRLVHDKNTGERRGWQTSRVDQ